jgi:hypothetical protein
MQWIGGGSTFLRVPKIRCFHVSEEISSALGIFTTSPVQHSDKWNPSFNQVYGIPNPWISSFTASTLSLSSSSTLVGFAVPSAFLLMLLLSSFRTPFEGRDAVVPPLPHSRSKGEVSWDSSQSLSLKYSFELNHHAKKRNPHPSVCDVSSERLEIQNLSRNCRCSFTKFSLHRHWVITDYALP